MDIGDLIETIGDIGANLPSNQPQDSKRKRIFKSIINVIGVLIILTLIIIGIIYLIAEKL